MKQHVPCDTVMWRCEWWQCFARIVAAVSKFRAKAVNRVHGSTLPVGSGRTNLWECFQKYPQLQSPCFQIVTAVSSTCVITFYFSRLFYELINAPRPRLDASQCLFHPSTETAVQRFADIPVSFDTVRGRTCSLFHTDISGTLGTMPFKFKLIAARMIFRFFHLFSCRRPISPTLEFHIYRMRYYIGRSSKSTFSNSLFRLSVFTIL